MRDIQKISQLEPTIAFSEFDFHKNYQASFQASELGKLYRAIPFPSVTHSLGLKEAKIGREYYFSPEGKLALMFLKSYIRFSDAELTENLNSNIYYQLFCGVRINLLKPLTNSKLVSAIPCELASLLQ